MAPYYVVIHSTDREGHSTEVLAKIACTSKYNADELMEALEEASCYMMYRHNYTIEKGDV